MADRPRVLLATQSPAPSIIQGSVILHHHTWYGHIDPYHEVELEAVNRAIADPCLITESSTVPGDWVFVNQRDVNWANEVLRVPVRNIDTGTNIVTSAYHTNSGFHGNVIWQRGDE